MIMLSTTILSEHSPTTNLKGEKGDEGNISLPKTTLNDGQRYVLVHRDNEYSRHKPNSFLYMYEG